MKASREIRYEGRTGIVVVSITSERACFVKTVDSSADGWSVPVSKTVTVSMDDVTITLGDGKVFSGLMLPALPKTFGDVSSRYLSTYGVALGISDDVAERVSLAIAECKAEAGADAGWLAHLEDLARSDDASRKYEAGRKAVDDMMTLGGKSY